MVKEKIDDGTQVTRATEEGGGTACPLSGEKFETVPKLKGRERRERRERERGPDRPTAPTAKRIFHRPPTPRVWSIRTADFLLGIFHVI